MLGRLTQSWRADCSRNDLAFSIVDAVAFSVMVGIGETYLAAFVLALGLADVAAGLIATAPMLAGGVLQLASPWAVGKLCSHRRWVVICSYTQAFSLLLLMAAAILGPKVGGWVFLPASLYWAAGLATGPAWNTWIEQLVPRPIRARFMARRSRLSQFGLLFGFVAGGLLLQQASAPAQPALIFAVLFGVAAVGRFVSATFLSMHSEPAWPASSAPNVGLRDTLRTIHRHHGSRLVVYLLAVQTAVYLSAPYFTPYMLRKLEMSYVHYMLLIAMAFLGRVIALPWLGRFAQRFGANKLLWLGGIGITPMAAGWLVSDSFWFLMALQFSCGIVWGAYELAMCLSFFESIPREERVGMLTVYNLGNTLAQAGGAVLGGLVIHHFHATATVYLTIFALSSVGRLAALLLIPRSSSAPQAESARRQTPKDEPAATVLLRPIALRPSAGSLDRPILSESDVRMEKRSA